MRIQTKGLNEGGRKWGREAGMEKREQEGAKVDDQLDCRAPKGKV